MNDRSHLRYTTPGYILREIIKSGKHTIDKIIKVKIRII